MIYAPVIIPTLCRYKHFKRCLESLSRCTGAENTEVYIGLDFPTKDSHWEGYNKIKDYLRDCGNLGFKQLHIIERPYNYGLGSNGNYVTLKHELFKKYDRLISSEDDNEFAPCFLDYMNKALEKYKDNPKVYWITGYSHPYIEHITTENIIFKHGVCALGVGLWREKEKEYEKKSFKYFEGEITNWRRLLKVLKSYPLGIPSEIVMFYRKEIYGDICKGIFCRTEDVYQIWPRVSLVRNWGYDGSGEHCETNNEFSSQKISEDLYFELNDLPIKENPKELQYDRWKKFTKNKVKLIILLIKVPIYLIGYNIYKILKNN